MHAHLDAQRPLLHRADDDADEVRWEHARREVNPAVVLLTLVREPRSEARRDRVFVAAPEDEVTEPVHAALVVPRGERLGVGEEQPGLLDARGADALLRRRRGLLAHERDVVPPAVVVVFPHHLHLAVLREAEDADDVHVREAELSERQPGLLEHADARAVADPLRGDLERGGEPLGRGERREERAGFFGGRLLDVEEVLRPVLRDEAREGFLRVSAREHEVHVVVTLFARDPCPRAPGEVGVVGRVVAPLPERAHVDDGELAARQGHGAERELGVFVLVALVVVLVALAFRVGHTDQALDRRERLLVEVEHHPEMTGRACDRRLRAFVREGLEGGQDLRRLLLVEHVAEPQDRDVDDPGDRRGEAGEEARGRRLPEGRACVDLRGPRVLRHEGRDRRGPREAADGHLEEASTERPFDVDAPRALVDPLAVDGHLRATREVEHRPRVVAPVCRGDGERLLPLDVERERPAAVRARVLEEEHALGAAMAMNDDPGGVALVRDLVEHAALAIAQGLLHDLLLGHHPRGRVAEVESGAPRRPAFVEALVKGVAVGLPRVARGDLAARAVRHRGELGTVVVVGLLGEERAVHGPRRPRATRFAVGPERTSAPPLGLVVPRRRRRHFGRAWRRPEIRRPRLARVLFMGLARGAHLLGEGRGVFVVGLVGAFVFGLAHRRRPRGEQISRLARRTKIPETSRGA